MSPTAAAYTLRALPAERLPIVIATADPVSRAGLAAQLQDQPGMEVVDEIEAGGPGVTVVVADEVDDGTRGNPVHRGRGQTDRLPGLEGRRRRAHAAVRGGVSGVVRPARRPRGTFACDRGWRGRGRGPAAGTCWTPSLAGRPPQARSSTRGAHLRRVTEREVAVLRLLATASSTARGGSPALRRRGTVKNVIHDVESRLDLRNRTHAVASAIRQGLI